MGDEHCPYPNENQLRRVAITRIVVAELLCLWDSAGVL